MEIEIGIVVPAYICLPIWIAQRKHIFDRYGLKISLRPFGSTHAVTEAMQTGEISLSIGTPEGTIADAASGGALRLLGGFVQKPPLSMIAQKKHQSLADLRGARLGTTSLKEGTRHLMERMLSTVGLRYPEDYDFVIAGAHAQRWDALQAGTIDAAIQLTPFNYIAEAAGFSNLGDVDRYIPDFLFCAICANINWAADNRALVIDLLHSLLVAIDFLYESPEEGASILCGVIPSRYEFASRACREYTGKEMIPRNLDISERAYKTTLECLKLSKEIDGDIPLSLCAELSYLAVAQSRQGV